MIIFLKFIEVNSEEIFECRLFFQTYLWRKDTEKLISFLNQSENLDLQKLTQNQIHEASSLLANSIESLPVPVVFYFIEKSFESNSSFVNRAVASLKNSLKKLSTEEKLKLSLLAKRAHYTNHERQTLVFEEALVQDDYELKAPFSLRVRVDAKKKKSSC